MVIDSITTMVIDPITSTTSINFATFLSTATTL